MAETAAQATDSLDDAPPVSIGKVIGLLGEGTPKSAMKSFAYRRPDVMKRDRALVPLARSDILISMIQVLKRGSGEQELHTHTGMDGFWFVLSGQARFYGEESDPVAILNRHDGVFVPRNAAYWFEVGDCEVLELLQVESIDHRGENRMIVYSEAEKAPIEIFAPGGELLAANVQLGTGEE